MLLWEFIMMLWDDIITCWEASPNFITFIDLICGQSNEFMFHISWIPIFFFWFFWGRQNFGEILILSYFISMVAVTAPYSVIVVTTVFSTQFPPKSTQITSRISLIPACLIFHFHSLFFFFFLSSLFSP